MTDNSKLSQMLISSDESMLHALKQMDSIQRKLLIVFENDIFMSVLSIGDIQRAIINNKSLETPISEVMRKKIRVSHIEEDIDVIKARMMELRIECMPVLNEKSELVNVLFWEDLFPAEQKQHRIELDLPVVIMAGGKGTRLQPITNVLPKPLIPIGEKTIIEHIMDRFLEVGCDHFYISINHKAEFLKYYLGQLANPDYHITYIQEENPLGTVGSLSLIQDQIDRPFFLSNCDILVNERYEEIYSYHQGEGNELTLVAALKHYKIPYGTIESTIGGELVHLTEKPEITLKINTGLYLLEPHLLKEIPKNQFYHMTQLIEKIKMRNGKVGVFPVSEGSWQDIGEWREYIQRSKINLTHS